MIQSKIFSVILLGFFLCGSWASAQSPRKGAPASDCSGAWTGVVTYTKTQTQTDHKTVDRVSGRGKDTRDWEMHLDYKATVGVSEDPSKNGSSRAKASISHTLTSKETSIAVEKNSCDRGKTWQDMTGTFVSESKVSGQSKEDANVYIGLNSDGSYSVGVALPQIEGLVTGSDSSTFSGQCKPKEGKNHVLTPTRTTIPGNSLTSDNQRVDPNDPNRLSGSYSNPLPGGVVETITWNLQKCGAPLRIIDLKFEDMKYPKWEDWKEFSEQAGTVDGNWVRIKATVFNASSETKTGEVYIKETFKGDKWDGAKPDAQLKDAKFSVTLQGGEDREVEIIWDTSGYAWFDDGRPRLVQRIKAEAWENSKKVDEMTKNVKVGPRPLVLIPGLKTDVARFEPYQNILTTTHSYDWKAFTVIDVLSQGTIGGEGVAKVKTENRSVYDNADNLTQYIHNVRATRNAWHIDMLAHCTGGLVARLYVHKQMDVLPDGKPMVKNLLMMGTPNNGVPCADWRADEEHQQTAKELSQEEMGRFNQYVTQRKGTKFSILAGDLVPVMFCGFPQPNDSFVSLESAKYGIEDVTVTSALHNDLISTETFTTYVKPHIVTGPQGTYPFLKGK